MVDRFGLSHRRACRVIGLARSTQQYKSRKRDEIRLRERIRDMAQKKRKYGSPRIYTLLRREGWKINHKRVERIYREEGLSLRRKKRKKVAAMGRIITRKPDRANQSWSMDFAMDSLCNGRRFRILTIVDDYTRECPVIETDTSINGKRVVRALDRIEETRGLPESITVDNGPEFTGRALDEWAYRKKVILNFIRPGKPVENAYIESFIGKFRDECLNDNWFIDIQHARSVIEAWRQEYNRERPHRSLGQMTPEEFAFQTEKQLPALSI